MNYRGKGLTTQQLMDMLAAIETDPKNRLPPGGLYRFTPQARKKLGQIAWAIADNMADARAAAGNPVIADGYSGRQTNRR